MHILMLGTCDYVTLHGKDDFEDMVELRVLKYKDYPGLAGWVQCYHRPPGAKRKAGGQSEKVM